MVSVLSAARCCFVVSPSCRTAIPGHGDVVAGDEGDLDRRRLVVASLTGAVGADTVRIGAPLAWPTTLAGNSHLEDRNET